MVEYDCGALLWSQLASARPLPELIRDSYGEDRPDAKSRQMGWMGQLARLVGPCRRGNRQCRLLCGSHLQYEVGRWLPGTRPKHCALQRRWGRDCAAGGE